VACAELSEKYAQDCSEGAGAPISPPVESAKPQT